MVKLDSPHSLANLMKHKTKINYGFVSDYCNVKYDKEEGLSCLDKASP